MSSLSAKASVFNFLDESDDQEQERELEGIAACALRNTVDMDPVHNYSGMPDTVSNSSEQITSSLDNEDEEGRGDNQLPTLISDTENELTPDSATTVYGIQLKCTNSYFNFTLQQIQPYLSGCLPFHVGPGYKVPSLFAPYFYYITLKAGEELDGNQGVLLDANVDLDADLCQVHYIGDDYLARNPKTMRAIYRNPSPTGEDDFVVFYRFYYFCCPCMCEAWISPLFRSRDGCVCRDCGQFVMPCGHIDSVTPFKGEENCYGKFECHICSRNWSSKYSVSNGWEKCFTCKTTVYPFYQIAHSTLTHKLWKDKSKQKGASSLEIRKKNSNQGVYEGDGCDEEWTKLETIYFPDEQTETGLLTESSSAEGLQGDNIDFSKINMVFTAQNKTEMEPKQASSSMSTPFLSIQDSASCFFKTENGITQFF